MDFLVNLLLALGAPIFERVVIMLGAAKLEFGEPFVDSRPYLSPNYGSKFSSHGSVGTHGTVTYEYLNELKRGDDFDNTVRNRYYIHIPIHNRQKSRIEESVAKRVYAKLSFFDLEGNPLGNGKEFDGRWERSKQPHLNEDVEELRFVDIEPEDMKLLDIASQDIRGGNWYVWISEYYNVFSPDKMLKKDGFICKLQLRGRNFFNKSISYRFCYDDNGNPKFEKQDT